MQLNHIKGILIQEFYITRHSLEIGMDILFFPLINVLVFGFISSFLSEPSNASGAQYLLLGMLLWQIIYIAQYSMSVGSLWNIWSRNLSNMFIAPLTLKEYMIAHMLSGAIKAALAFIIFSFVAMAIFNFNIYSVGYLNIFFFYINLLIFAWSTGIFILAVIFRYGTRIQALAWGLIFLFQPLTASLFPVKVLPPILQKIAYLFPPTYVFEAARGSFNNQIINWQLLGISFIENIIYMAISIWFFILMFKKAKDSGQFARNEG